MAEHKTSRHKVGFTDADFKRAIERAGKLRHEPLAAKWNIRRARDWTYSW